MFDPQIVSFHYSPGCLELQGLPILIDPNDFEGIHIAASNLAIDLQKVTGRRSDIWTSLEDHESNGVIVIGSLQRSGLVQELSQQKDNQYSRLQGEWESFHTQVQSCPWPCSERMLVVAGSDKRGTIFGCYTLSEQMGVSPWYWWADVHIRPQPQVYALPISTVHGGPSVQYRGIFINDEAPALTDWVHGTFGPKYNSDFYKKVFELLLRMKANFLWPAMWSGFPEPGSIFFTDDPLNQQLADKYGVVISTSHHEPMGGNMSEWRASDKGEWVWETNKPAIREYFATGAERSKPYESLLTIGMRGDSDVSIISKDPKLTLKDVIKTQRDIIESLHGARDGVGQVMALYKEVQHYYEDGLEIPEDVTLLFADDNFGNIRRHPTESERTRRGGSGVYYHLEYVGTPRSYKWLNSNTCGKLHQQLSSAWTNGIRKIWVFNVGDIKPQEVPLSFALALAWDVKAVQPTTIPKFLSAFAEREFGTVEATEISQLLLGHDRLVALRRHEHIEPDTFSILNYRESEVIVDRFKSLEKRADALFGTISAPQKASFFQLVLHPIRASRINAELRMSQAQNKLHGLQRRNTTNALAERCLQLFEEDWDLAETYHRNPWTAPQDKWRHMMEQPHYGYSPDTWHAPSRDMITGLSFVQRRQNSNRIVGQMGIMVEGHTGVRPGIINEESDRTHPSRGDLTPGLTLPRATPHGPRNTFFEVYSRGTIVVDWTATVGYTWISLSQASGHLTPDAIEHRVYVSVDWPSVPPDFDSIVTIEIRAKTGEFEQVHLPVTNRTLPQGFRGFPEADGYLSIDPGAVELDSVQSPFYEHLPYLGRSDAGSLSLKESAISREGHGPIAIPWLEYPLWFFSESPWTTSGKVVIRLYFTMTLDPLPGHPLTYDIGLDDSVQENIPLLRDSGEYIPAPSLVGEKEAEDTVSLPVGLPQGWMTATQDNVWLREREFEFPGPGKHIIKYRPLERGLLLEKLVIDVGGLRESYLGPPPTDGVP